MCMEKKDNNNFSKKFNRIELFFVPDNEIPKDILKVQDCRKIPKVKSYNTATAISKEKCVYVRDSTCSFCHNCLTGDVLSCTSKKNGEWKKNYIRKVHKIRKTKIVVEVSSEESEDEEFIYEYSDDQESDISDQENNDTNSLEDLSKGRYVLYESKEKKYHVGSIVEYSDEKVVLKIAKKHGVRGNKITFVWPVIDNFVVVENLTKHVKVLPDPIANRRYSLIFNLEAFGKKLPKNIC